MPPVIPNPANIFEFKTESEFERWIAANQAHATEVWIKVHKKGSGLPSITTAEALDVALCWGWIDAIRKSFDDKSFLQRYTPRQKRSPWSLINTHHVARLINAGRMKPAGHAQIEAAKADGRWEIAYTGSRDMKAPADLMAAIDANPKARALYDNLTSQNRYALSFRLVSLKTEAARVRKIATFVEMLARGETIYPNRPTAVLLKELKATGRPLAHKKPTKTPTKKTATKTPAKATTKAVAKTGTNTARTNAKTVAKKAPAKKVVPQKKGKRQTP